VIAPCATSTYISRRPEKRVPPLTHLRIYGGSDYAVTAP
jgi:hypothetical protein